MLTAIFQIVIVVVAIGLIAEMVIDIKKNGLPF